VLSTSGRVLVAQRGRIAAPFFAVEAAEDKIMSAAFH
jgi:ABC-type sugar transport system ATPase subunit